MELIASDLPKNGSGTGKPFPSTFSNEVTCPRCRYSWQPRIPRPARCSRCKARLFSPVRVFKTHPDFWMNVQKGEADECWPFMGLRNRDGYGSFKKEAAMREAYRLAAGPIPAGYNINHLCDNRACCNPKHLYAGTQTQNMRDRVIRTRAPGPAPSAASL